MIDDIGFGMKNDDLLNSSNTPTPNIFNYKCNSCATLVRTSSTISNCPYCGGEVSSVEDNTQFESVITFNKSLEESIHDYKKKVLYNPLIPFIFKKKKTINSIEKLYIPATLNSVTISGNTTFLGANKTKKGQKLSEIQKYNLSYTSNFNYNNVYINTYSKINDIYLNNILDYNFNDLKPYNDTILEDICTILPDEKSESKLKKKTMSHALTVIRDNINYGLKKLDTNEMTITNNSTINILVPVYILRINYKGGDYLYIMNGQTGTSIINPPLGIKETIITSLVIFIIIFLLSYLITYFI